MRNMIIVSNCITYELSSMLFLAGYQSTRYAEKLHEVMGDMEEPPPIEDGSSVGMKRHGDNAARQDTMLKQKFSRF